MNHSEPDSIYIRMCEKALEVQALKTQKNVRSDDPFVSKEEFKEKHDQEREWHIICEWIRDEHIWLPRQENLQRIMLNEYSLRGIFSALGEDIIEMKGYLNGLKSGEQLWLAFLMKEMYNKVWDGNNWVVIV